MLPSIVSVAATAATLLSLAPNVAAVPYSLARSYEGSTFFDRWSYYGNYDNLTNGDAIFVNRSNTDLTYINAQGNAILKVDNTTVVPYNEKRDTFRLTSTDSYGVGTLLVFDALHVPYGCSVWGAWWTRAADWPAGGEIDIFEGVNQQTTNQMALHTTDGCMAAGTSATQTGNLTYPNCFNLANGNSGCTVKDPDENSYGAGFAAAGGGVWVTEFAASGINIWFFTRSEVPAVLSSNNATVIDPSSWGLPVAAYSTSSCNIGQYFQEQFLELDVTLCGDWAGSPAVFNETCTGVCYLDYVLKAESYNTAYFEIQHIKIFQSAGATGTNATATASTPTASTGSTTGNNNANTANGASSTPTGAGVKTVNFGGAGVALALLVSVAGAVLVL